MLAPLGQNLYAIALWDEDWQCYNNAYLLRRGACLLLIDCGKAVQGAALQSDLAALDLRPADVTDLIATHRHADHVGNAALFEQAHRWIHPTDWALLTPDLQALFTPSLPDDGPAWSLLGFHTPGSVSLFDAQTGALFVGDHICFPGLAPGAEGLVASSPEMHAQALAHVSGWGDSDAARGRYDMDLFRAGVAALAQLPARYLCTGHGVILTGDMPAFLAHVLEQA